MGREGGVITVCLSLFRDDSYYLLISITYNSNCVEVGVAHLQPSKIKLKVR